MVEMWQPNATLNNQVCKNSTGHPWAPDQMKRWDIAGGALYNGQVLPYVNMTIKGALWWQGENVSRRASPPCLSSGGCPVGRESVPVSSMSSSALFGAFLPDLECVPVPRRAAGLRRSSAQRPRRRADGLRRHRTQYRLRLQGISTPARY